MDEDFLDVTESSKKVGLIFVFFIVLIALLGYFLVFKKVHYSVRTIKVELGDDLSTNVEDYLSKTEVDLDEFTLDVSKVNTKEVGEYTYTVKHDSTTKKGKVKVVDTTAPEFSLKEVTIEVGIEDFYLGEFLETCEDFSKPCVVSFKNSKDEEKLKTVGEYTIDIEVADTYGNKKEAKANLKVVNKGTIVDEKAKDLEYASNSEGIEDFKGLTYEKWEVAFPEGSDELEGKIVAASAIDFDKYINANFPGKTLKEANIIRLYNKSKYAIGISIQITLSDNSVIYVDKSKVVEDISQAPEE